MTITYLKDACFLLQDKENKILTDPLKVDAMEINNEGEYEINGITVEVIDGIKAVRAKGLNIALIDKRKTILKEEEVSKLGAVDVLFISMAGGEEYFSVKEALQQAGELEPRILIPMRLKETNEFCKQEGICNEPVKVFKITKNNLPQEERQILIFGPTDK